jgi:integration host factor subunit alpha
MTLTKADIVAQVYAQGVLTKAEAAGSVERTLELIKSALGSEDEVLVSGFGKWSVRRKAARRGRNPQTGDPLTLPPRKVVTFKPSRVLKARVQGQAPAKAAPDQQPRPTPRSEEPQDAKPKSGVLRRGYF